MATVKQKLSTPSLNKLDTPTNATTPGTPNNRANTTSKKNPLILLVGKLVFLDLNSTYKPLNKVKQCLNQIGAKIADCLSKDVDYVISNREAATCLDTSLDSTKKSKTSPNALNLGSRSSFINRTQSILEKASKGFTSSDILSTARRLGIKVMNINEIERHIEKYLNKIKKADETTSKVKTELVRQSSFQLNKLSNQKILKLKTPFLKIESICKQYKPNYEEFDTWHEINLDIFTTKSTSSPFQIYFSDDIKADENDEDQISSQNQQSTKNFFKSPASSKIPNDPSTVKSNVLLNCSNNYTTVQKLANSKSIHSGLCNNVKNKITMFNNQANTPVAKSNGAQLMPLNATKRKPTGYCECCKQRYDNLKQHLTSITHENFDRNLSNFKELDEFVDGKLNFKQYLTANNLDNYSNGSNEPKDTTISIEQTKEFAKEFNKKRESLGFSKFQVVAALNSYQEPIFDESALNRFEKLDITPRSAARMKPVLEKWLTDTNLKFGDRLKSFNQVVVNKGNNSPTDHNASTGSKKRKRFSFSPRTLEVLNKEYSRISQPSDTDLAVLSSRLNQEKEEISLWFIDKQSNDKKNKKKFKQSNVLHGLLNDSVNSSSDNDSSFLKSSPIEPKPVLPTTSPTKNLEKHRSSKSLTNVLESTSKKKLKSKPLLNRLHMNQAPENLTPISIKKAAVTTYEMSSPSAQVLFALNSNSFTIPNEVSITVNKKQPNDNDENNLLQVPLNGVNNSKSDNSTDLSVCVDDSIFHAFYNDFSYEIVQKP